MNNLINYHSIVDRFFYKSTDGKRLNELKDIHKGERCFVIGNGPSLNHHNLLKLSNEIKFATNNFILHNDLDKIHLNYFCVSDPLHWKGNAFLRRWIDILQKINYCTLFLELDSKLAYKQTPELRNHQVYFINLNMKKPVFRGNFSTDVTDYTCWGRTVIIDLCLPLVYHMGFKEVFLLGCDCDFGKADSVNNLKNNYFYDPKLDERELYLFDPIKWRDHVILSYQVVKKIFEADGRKIYNAGYGGKLDIFERMDYDELF